MQNSGIKSNACVPSRRGDTAVSQHKTKRTLKSKGVNKKLSATHKSSERDSKVRESCKLVTKVMPQVEYKEPIPTYRGKDAPSSLSPPASGFKYEDTKESISLRGSLRSLFGDKHYKFRLSTVLNMSSSGAGIVNSTIAVSALQFVSDFVSLSTVFNEFFVVSMCNKWEPVSRYQYPLGGSSILSVSSLPLGLASLQHGATAYTSLAGMADNYDFDLQSTGDPFRYDWHNTEKAGSTIVAEQSGNTQSWCTTGNVANYQGQIQALTQSSPPALPFSQVLGTFFTVWEVIFRIRQ